MTKTRDNADEEAVAPHAGPEGKVSPFQTRLSRPDHALCRMAEKLVFNTF